MTRHLSVVMFTLAAGLLLAPLAHVGGRPEAASAQALGVLFVLAAISLAAGRAGEIPAVLSGIVVVVECDTGTLALQQADGTRRLLQADPGLLLGIRFGDRVRVVVGGSLVRALRRPPAAWRRARQAPAASPPLEGGRGAAPSFRTLEQR